MISAYKIAIQPKIQSTKDVVLDVISFVGFNVLHFTSASLLKLIKQAGRDPVDESTYTLIGYPFKIFVYLT